MKKLIKILCLIFCLIFIIPFSACSKVNLLDLTYFNTGIHIEIKGKPLSDTTKDRIENTLYSLEKEFSVRNGSFTTEFNKPTAKTFALSSTGEELFSKIQTAYNLSDGKFNPLVYPLVKLWGFSTNYPQSNFCPPHEEDIDGALSHTDFNDIDITDGLLTKKDENLQIDFGGILKGYAVEKIADILIEEGYKEGYINIGGSSMFILQSDSLSIRHPESTDKNIIKINCKELKNFAVSTSGTYERFYTYQGKTYSHIISPFDGKPSQENITSATILGIDGAVSDALTTTLCLCDFEIQLPALMKNILNNYKNAVIFAVYNDGENKKILTNAKESENFTLLDPSYTVINLA